MNREGQGLRTRLSYANVVATIALFASLGGTSVAALKVGSRELRDDSVRTADLRNNDVRGGDVRNGTLRGTDVRNGSLTRADIRARSLTGAQLAPESVGSGQVNGLLASDFAAGQLPDPVPATLPSGKTLTGTFGVAVTGGSGGSGIARGAISFPVPLAAAPSAAQYVGQGEGGSGTCPGRASAPTAAPGAFCLYEAGVTGTVALRGFFDPVTGSNFSSSRFGAVAFVNGDAGAGIRGTWAVTAP